MITSRAIWHCFDGYHGDNGIVLVVVDDVVQSRKGYIVMEVACQPQSQPGNGVPCRAQSGGNQSCCKESTVFRVTVAVVEQFPASFALIRHLY